MKAINVDRILKEYLYNDAPKKEFNEWYKYNAYKFSDTVKYIIINDLSETEKRMLLIYIHTGNYSKAAKILDVSVGTIFSRIKTIKEKIQQKVYDYND